jgi:hypothetical protein
MEAAGHDVSVASRILSHFVSIQEVFEQFRTSILDALERSPL